MKADESRPTQNHLLAIALRTGAVACFATLGAMVKLAFDAGVSAPEALFYRFLFGLPPLLLWIWWSGDRKVWRTTRPLAHLARSSIGFATMALNFVSLFYLPLPEAIAIGFATPFFAVVMSALFLRERIGPHRWLAVVLGFIGVLIVTRPDANHLSQIGLILATIAAFGGGVVTITLRSIGRTEGTQTTVLIFTLTALPVFGALMPFFGESHSPSTWGILAAIGLSGGMAQILLTAALRYAPVAVTVPFDYTQLLWAALLGGLIWGTYPLPSTWIGAILIVGAGLYATLRERQIEQANVTNMT